MLPSGAPPPGGRRIADGDLVIAYENYDNMKGIYVDAAKGQLSNRHGNFLHRDWIGKPFGSKVFSTSGTGFVHLLAPTPELWTQVLKHRTQILYAGDIGLICSNLDLSPGRTVLESGTGSGSLSTSLSRAVGPSGRVLTFEFHKERSEIAAAEFKRNGLPNITVTQRNIEEDGFPEELHGEADALFLDLPGPWKVVPSAAACLKPDGCFCSFSPCIEQVQRTCEKLAEHGFRDIRTMEILLRYYRVTNQKLITDLDRFDAPSRSLSWGDDKKSGKKRRQPEADNGVSADAASQECGAQSDATAKAPETETMAVCQPEDQARGHTGYLTFARRRVVVASGGADADKAPSTDTGAEEEKDS